MKTGNVVQEKTYAFAVKIVKHCRFLMESKKNSSFQNNYCVQELQLEQILKRLLEVKVKRIFMLIRNS